MVNVVDHRDILPADALPTFNSHAIETVAAPHRGPGRALRLPQRRLPASAGRIRPEALFSPAGLTSVFFSQLTIGLTDAPDAAPFLQAAWNNRHLLHDAFGAVTTTQPRARAVRPPRLGAAPSSRSGSREEFAATVAHRRSAASADVADAQLAGPALRPAHRHRVRRRPRRAPPHLRQPQQRRRRLAAAAGAAPPAGLPLPGRPPRPRARRASGSTSPHGVLRARTYPSPHRGSVTDGPVLPSSSAAAEAVHARVSRRRAPVARRPRRRLPLALVARRCCDSRGRRRRPRPTATCSRRSSRWPPRWPRRASTRAAPRATAASGAGRRRLGPDGRPARRSRRPATADGAGSCRCTDVEGARRRAPRPRRRRRPARRRP